MDNNNKTKVKRRQIEVLKQKETRRIKKVDTAALSRQRTVQGAHNVRALTKAFQASIDEQNKAIRNSPPILRKAKAP